MALLLGSGSSGAFGAFDKEKFQAQAHKRFVALVEAERRRYEPAATAGRTAQSQLTLSSPLTVCVRKRPLNTLERASSQYDVISCPDSRTVIIHEPKVRYDLSQVVCNHSFTFDAVYEDSSSTLDMYKELLRPLVLSLDRGAQVTCFAYGQTGSGKSYTMGGLTHATLEDIFRLCCTESNRSRELFVSVAYYEVYCAKCYDLLNDRAVLPLREDESSHVQVVGLTEHGTRDIRIVRELLARGAAARSTGTTKVNADSSRSHSVLQLLVREGAPLRDGSSPVVGKCTLVDLAGSEQAHEMEERMDRAAHHEAAEINKSLLALKECIRAMARGQAQSSRGEPPALPGRGQGSVPSRGSSCSASSLEEEVGVRDEGRATGPASARHGAVRAGVAGGRPPLLTPYGRVQAVSAQQAGGRRVGAHRTSKKPHVHIPFRGSKLTQILRDCFTTPGAVTLMVATIGPGSTATEHSLNTLRYADRLKGIGRRHAGGQEGSTSIAQAASAAARTTAALSENSASTRTGLLAPADAGSGREGVSGGFTATNPLLHVQPPGLEAGHAGGGYGVLPVPPTWPVGGVPPASVWRDNEAAVQGMRAEHAAQGAWEARGSTQPSTAMEGRPVGITSSPLPPVAARPREGEGEGEGGDGAVLAMLNAQIAQLERVKARVQARAPVLPPPAPAPALPSRPPTASSGEGMGRPGGTASYSHREVRRPSLLQDALTAAHAAVQSIAHSVQGGLTAASSPAGGESPAAAAASLTGRQGGARQPLVLTEARPPAVLPLQSTSALVEVLDARREQPVRNTAVLPRQRQAAAPHKTARPATAQQQGQASSQRPSPYAQQARMPPPPPPAAAVARLRTAAAAKDAPTLPSQPLPRVWESAPTRRAPGGAVSAGQEQRSPRMQAPASAQGSPKPEKKVMGQRQEERVRAMAEGGRDVEFLRPSVHLDADDDAGGQAGGRISRRAPVSRPRTAPGLYPLTVSSTALASAYKDMDLHNIAGHPSRGPVVVARLAGGGGGATLQLGRHL